MQACVRCLVDIPSIIFVFLDVSVDVAPLLAVAKAIKARHATKWSTQLVRELLSGTPLVVSTDLHRQIVCGILQERGIATDSSHYYEWYAIQLYLRDAIRRWMDRYHRAPTYVALYDMLEEGVPWLQQLRGGWSGLLRLALREHIAQVSDGRVLFIPGVSLSSSQDPLDIVTRTMPSMCSISRLVRYVETERVTPLCSLAAVASGLVATEVDGDDGA